MGFLRPDAHNILVFAADGPPCTAAARTRGSADCTGVREGRTGGVSNGVWLICAAKIFSGAPLRGVLGTS